MYSSQLQTFVYFLGGVGSLCQEFFSHLSLKKIDRDLLFEQIYQIGARSLPLVIVTAVSTGMVMSLQFGIGLEKFGGKPYVAKIVTLSILRELGPVFASLMVAARVGAGIASEIGSMVVTQQIDAIRALGTSPIQKIVLPRILACVITVPILAVFANCVGIFGAMIVGITELNLDPYFFMNKVLENDLRDFSAGFFKTFFFAFIIAIVSCYLGLQVKEGTRGVGLATTKAVVASSIGIFIGDYFLTKLFWVIEQWMYY